MSTHSYQVRLDIYQKLRIDELEEEKAQLIIQLHDAEVDVGHLQLEVEKLEGGQLALTVALQDANNEVGRLSMLVKHRK